MRVVDDEEHATDLTVGGDQPVHGADHHVPGELALGARPGQRGELGQHGAGLRGQPVEQRAVAAEQLVDERGERRVGAPGRARGDRRDAPTAVVGEHGELPAQRRLADAGRATEHQRAG